MTEQNQHQEQSQLQSAATQSLSNREWTVWLFLLPLLSIVFHLIFGNRYGFHRDELAFLDDARHLAWGYVAYPPVTPFAGRLSIALFGISPLAFRLPASLANAIALFLIGCIARELGGRRRAQFFAMLAGLPIALALGSLMQYNSFDYLAWALVAYFTARRLTSGDSRWWLAIGATVGFGILSKLTIALLILSLLAALAILPDQRSELRSRWLYLGSGLALLIASPYLIWQVRHHFITLKMMSFIHARDVAIGRTDGFLSGQLLMLGFVLIAALSGLYWLLRTRRFRLLAAFFIGPLILLLLSKGRDYYLLPGYITLYAAGGIAIDQWLQRRTATIAMVGSATTRMLLLIWSVILTVNVVPISHPGTSLFAYQMKKSGDLRDEIGWPELVQSIANVRSSLPASEQDHLGILAGNYGEAGAIALYGPRLHLPTPISGINSFYARGYGNVPPETVIAVGMGRDFLQTHFQSCAPAGDLNIPYGVRNEESVDHPHLWVCHHLKGSWADLWAHFQYFA